MTRIGMMMGIMALVLACSEGCGLRRSLVPCCNGGCGPGSCGACCGVANDPILGDCNKCGVCGGGNCPGFTPCGYLKYMLTCGAGCGGEMYYGEWVSDPPACCDPCDNCGNWTGETPCCARRAPIVNAVSSMWWGCRYPGSCCGDSCCGGGAGGCTSGAHAVGTPGVPGQHVPAPAKRAPGDVPGESPEEVQPMNTAIPTPARYPRRAPEPKAARPPVNGRTSYNQARVPMRPGSYRGEPSNNMYPASYRNAPAGY